MKEGHELLRGKGTFDKALATIDHLQKADIRVSIATMIHRGDLKEFDSLASLLNSKDIKEWNIDQPSIAGRLEGNRELWVSPFEAAPFLQYGYGGGGTVRPRKIVLVEPIFVLYYQMEISVSVGSSVRSQWDPSRMV